MSAEQESILTVQLASRLKACSSIIGVIFDDELEQTLSELTDEEMGFTASAPGMLADTGERLSAIQQRIKLLRESAKKVRRALTYARDAQILDEPPRTMSDTVSSAAKPDLPLHETDRSTKGKRISDSYEADRNRIFSKVQDAGSSITESGSDNMKVIIKSADIGKLSFRDTTKEGSVRTERTEDISGKDKFKDDYQQEKDHQKEEDKEGQIKESESKHSIFSSTDSDECSDYFATLKDHVHTAEDPSSHSSKKLKPSFLNSTTEWLMKVLRRSSSGNDVADDPEAAKARKTIAIHLLKALERLGQLKLVLCIQIARNRRSEPTILKFTLPL